MGYIHNLPDKALDGDINKHSIKSNVDKDSEKSSDWTRDHGFLPQNIKNPVEKDYSNCFDEKNLSGGITGFILTPSLDGNNTQDYAR